jgi:hypothetical protein
MRSIRRYIVLVFGLLILNLPLGANADVEEDNILQLMLAAIDGGKSHGRLTGSTASKFREMTTSNDPIIVDVTTVQKLSQEGCSRLNVRMVQGNVPKKDGTKAAFEIDYQLNLCRDGGPPGQR